MENLEYDSMITEEGIHNYEPGHKGIIRADDVEERLIDSLENSLESSLKNQHTEELIEKKNQISKIKFFLRKKRHKGLMIFILMIVL